VAISDIFFLKRIFLRQFLTIIKKKRRRGEWYLSIRTASPPLSHTKQAKNQRGMDTHADLKQQQGATLRRLCQQGDTMLIQHMLRSGAPVDSCQADGCTGLWLACEQGHVDVVTLLCNHGANVHVTKQPGDVTPLYIAAQNGHTNVVTLLLQHGALPNAAKATGATPLYIAAQQNFSDIVSALLRAGAGVGIVNHQGIGPLAIACFLGNLESVKLLLQAGADPDVQSGGKTPLEWATSNGNGQTVGRVLEQFRESKQRDVERRRGLARGDDVTPMQQHERTVGLSTPIRGGGHADPAVVFGGRGNDETPWYTPKYLTYAPSSGAAAYALNNVPAFGSPLPRGVAAPAAVPLSTGTGLDHVTTAIGLQRSPYRTVSGGGHFSNPPAPVGTSAAQHQHRAAYYNQSHTAAAASGFSCGGAMTPAAIEEEAQRNEMFRKQISKRSTGVAPAPLEKPNKAALYAVSQEWNAFKERLSNEEFDLDASKAEVSHSWMYSFATVAQYENTLRGIRKGQAETLKANRDKMLQDNVAKGKNGFTFPPLAGERLDTLRHFVAQGAQAKGPPPLTAEGGEEAAQPTEDE
jgi:hypothetical protein